MRFLIDANMPRSIIALVTNLGHEVESRPLAHLPLLCREASDQGGGLGLGEVAVHSRR